MSIDIKSEDVITFAEASRSLPGRPSLSTLWRWHARGIRGVKLETVVIGGIRYVSREALQRFADRLTEQSDDSVPVRTARQRERDIERAERELADAGI